MDRAAIVHEAFIAKVADNDLPPGQAPRGPLGPETAEAIFRAGCLSRALDLEAREMQRRKEGFYTIGSSGHEGMAAVAAALRPTDLAFLHYRDAAFQIARAAQVPGQTPARDMLLSFACSSEDPISGGRHKVLGSKALAIPPQTSTIASHLPKAVGAAYSVALARRHGLPDRSLADDGIVVSAFGDASANHSTAQGAINTACWTAFQSVPMPILFLCEDNGIGISVRTPKGWIAASFAHRPGLAYFTADGLDMFETFRVATEAADYVRKTRKPAFLHLRTVRLLGHAGADIPTSYMSRAAVEADEANDPLLHSVRLLRDADVLSPASALEIYLETRAQVARLAAEVAERPHLETAAGVMASLLPPKSRRTPARAPAPNDRRAAFGPDFKAIAQPQIMSRLINWAMTDLMLTHPEIAVMGEDVARKGGVYGVTQKLTDRFGADRVIDTLLDEQSILGLAIGMAHNGFVPMPEIQFLAYLHNAEDQLRGEAATLPFFSNGQFANPMVVRIAGLGYQKGFGGHFHNDNALAVLRDIPGLVLACPARGGDAVAMLREAVRLARDENRVVVFLEPIALYGTRDLHEDGDGLWMDVYPDLNERIGLGEIGVSGDGPVALVSFANGFRLCRQAQRLLAAQGIETRAIDLRWLSPLPVQALVDALKGASHVLVVDETRAAGGVSEGVIAALNDRLPLPLARLAAEDSFIATGPAHAATLPSVDTIVASVRALLAR